MIRYHKAIVAAVLIVALALGLPAADAVFQPPVAHAQGFQNTLSKIYVVTYQDTVHEGGLATFTVTRSYPFTEVITVRVKTWEPNHEDPLGQNETEQFHDLKFERGVRGVTLSVLSYVDEWQDVGDLELMAEVQPSPDDSYQVGDQPTATVEVVDVQGNVPPAGLTAIGLSSDQTFVAEGGTATFTVHRYGETTQPLAVGIRVEDPKDLFRGNHWDPPPQLPTQVEFAVGSTSETLSIPVPDDRRLVFGLFKVVVAPSNDYLIRGSGIGFKLSAQVDVAQNEAIAQQFELHFGKNGVNNADANEGDRLKFIVKRGQEDAETAQTVAFFVRVETDRTGTDSLLDDWTEDTDTGRLFKDYPLELTGSATEIAQEIAVIENRATEGDWSYWASIRALEDFDGNPLTEAEEAEYWTVKQGFRETTIDVTDNGGSIGEVRLRADRSVVYEGAEVLFTLTRSGGPMGKELRIRLQSGESNLQVGFGVNPSDQNSIVAFEPWQSTATLKITAYVDGVSEAADSLEVENTHVGSGYLAENPNRATVEINDPPSSSAIIGISANTGTVAEGGQAGFTLSRSGNMSSDVTVNLRYDDPHELLRGNHWDPAPDLTTAITMPANTASLDFTVPVPDDQRDVDGQSFTLAVVPSDDYLLGNTGLSTSATVAVTDNDTAQEMQFQFGSIDRSTSEWEEGQTYQTCVRGECTPGPAEGLFYYEDGRTFPFTQEVEERLPVHFRVIRRAEDVGKTATFVVRVEHNRGWESPRHAGWPIDPVTGNHYQEFPLTLTGNQRQVVGRIEVLDNGILDPLDWEYSAEIKRVEDVAGDVLTPEQEAQYWTVNESGSYDREYPFVAEHKPLPQYTITSSDPTPNVVREGQQATFTLERFTGNPLESAEIPVRTWEPNRRGPDGDNPSEQIHMITIPAMPMTDLWVDYEPVAITFTVTATDDSDVEDPDYLRARMLDSVDRSPLSGVDAAFLIVGDDYPSVRLSVDSTSVTEGDPVAFTLTREGGTTGELTVGVAVDDPGGFLKGNSPSEAVAVPSNVAFAPGETVREITLTPPDDWRDIPNGALTFRVIEDKRKFEIVGPVSLTVQVADNDVAPQVAISFNESEVVEGTDLVLTIEPGQSHFTEPVPRVGNLRPIRRACAWRPHPLVMWSHA